MFTSHSTHLLLLSWLHSPADNFLQSSPVYPSPTPLQLPDCSLVSWETFMSCIFAFLCLEHTGILKNSDISSDFSSFLVFCVRDSFEFPCSQRILCNLGNLLPEISPELISLCIFFFLVNYIKRFLDCVFLRDSFLLCTWVHRTLNISDHLVWKVTVQSGHHGPEKEGSSPTHSGLTE